MRRFILPHHRWALLLIVLLGFTLRLYGLGDIAVNSDEASDYDRYVSDSFSNILVDELVLNSQSFSYVLSRIALLSLGNRLFTIRWPALLVSMLGIAALHRLTRELFGQRAALFSGLLLALSPFAIFFAHSFRGYSGVIHWPIMIYLAGLLALKTNRWHTWLALSLLTVVMFYTHLFTILAYLNLLLLMALLWVAKAQGRKGAKSQTVQEMYHTPLVTRTFAIRNSQFVPSMPKLVASVALTTALLVILYAPVWLKLLNPPPGSDVTADVVWVQRPEVSASVWYNLWLYNGYWQAGSQAGHGVLVLLPLIAGGVWAGFAAHRGGWVLALLGWALLPFVEIWLLGLLLNNFWVRPPYLSYTLPPLLILAGVGFDGLFKWATAQKKLNRSVSLAVVSLLLVLLWAFALREYYAVFGGANWQAIGNFIQQQADPTDLVICQQYRHNWQAVHVSAKDNCTRTLTYRRTADISLLAEVNIGYYLIFDQLEQAVASGTAQRSGRVWLVVWDAPPQAPLPGFHRFGSGAVLLTDSHTTYIENMHGAMTQLHAGLPLDGSQFVYSLMVAPLSMAAGQPEQAAELLSLAAQHQPDHPKSDQMLTRVTALVEALKLLPDSLPAQ